MGLYRPKRTDEVGTKTIFKATGLKKVCTLDKTKKDDRPLIHIWCWTTCGSKSLLGVLEVERMPSCLMILERCSTRFVPTEGISSGPKLFFLFLYSLVHILFSWLLHFEKNRIKNIKKLKVQSKETLICHQVKKAVHPIRCLKAECLCSFWMWPIFWLFLRVIYTDPSSDTARSF